MARRAAEQRVAAKAAEELGVVVVDGEAEAQTLQAAVALRREVHAAIRVLACERALEPSVDLERRDDQPSRNVRVASPRGAPTADSMYGPPAGRSPRPSTNPKRSLDGLPRLSAGVRTPR